MASPEAYTRVEVERIAVVQLERCAEHMQLFPRDGERLLDAVLAVHLSLFAALTVALTRTDSGGALTARSELSLRAARQGDGTFDEKVMSFKQLVERAQASGAFDRGTRLGLSENEENALERDDPTRKRIQN